MWTRLACGSSERAKWTARGLVSIGLAASFAAAAPADASTLWWTGDLDDDAARHANWTIDPSHWHRLPGDDIAVYVTTADHHGVHPGQIDAWPRVSDVDLGVGGLYVGGWPRPLFAEFGDPAGHGGRLTLESGSLTTAEREGSPPCDYVRVGHNGAEGALVQTGGALRSCTFVSLAFGRGSSEASFELGGGEVSAFGIDTGVSGTGRTRQTGGRADLRVHNVGRGYALEGDFDPGSGFFQLRGGEHTVIVLRLGDEPGAMGLASIQGGTLSADTIEVGREGSGALLHAGGQSRAGTVIVGHRAGGSGQLTVSGGSLEIGRVLSVGHSAGGRGRATLTATGRIDTQRLEVHDGSTLQFVPDRRGAGRIVAAGAAEFREGATVDIDVALTPGNDPEPTLDVVLGDRLVLVEAASVVGAVRLAEEDAADWRLRVHPGGIEAVYYPCELRCDLDYDGRVGGADLVLLGDTEGKPAIDCDGDGVATFRDFFALSAEFGASCPR
ncbi:MAG: hypothetical protein QNK04_20695 [Myxococcota bacterium]|nr:hypothetical protein [Myxococcota bacterium]